MILWILLPVLVVLAMSAGVQAQELREVPASEILEQIRAGEDVSYRNVRITGEFNLSKIKLKTEHVARSKLQIKELGLEVQIKELDSEEELKIVESKIIINDSVFENEVDFSNTRFREALDFRDTFFLGETDFSGARFSSDVTFGGADFSEGVDFTSASFSGGAIFSGSDFGHAEFRGARFDGCARFEDANFDYAEFMDARFSGYTTFWGARFDGDARFLHVSFEDYAYFDNASFDGDVLFSGASFCDGAKFSDARFSGNAHFGASFDEAYFEYARFGGRASFSCASSNGYIIFNHAIFSDTAYFKDARFDKVVFKNTTFTEVNFNEIGFRSMEISWSSLKDALVFDGPTYIKLIKNFREMEQFGDADDAYYQYRRLSQANKEWSFSKLSDIFMELSCGYGVKPWRAPVWGVLIIFIFGLIYMPGTLNFWPFTLRYRPFTLFDWLRESGIRRLKERDEGDEQDASLCEVLYFIIVALTIIGFMWLSCGYGVKPHYTAILAVAIIFIFGHIYRGNDIDKRDASFCDAFYFSVTTFTTLGYGDWYPKDRYRMFVMIEGLLGWLTLALFLVTLANVMIRP